VGPFDHKDCVLFLCGRTFGVRSLSMEQGRQGTCGVWHIRVAMVPVETQPCVLVLLSKISQQYTNNERCAEKRFWRIYVGGNNKTHVGLHAKCPKFLSDFKQIFESF
jgi:hypothetical protein